MTTAEKYRQKESSAVVQIAKYIFNVTLRKSTRYFLGDLLEEIKTGKTPSKHEKKYYEDDYLDWYKPNEIGSEKYLYLSNEKLSKYAYEKGQATVYKPDTILINAIGDVGRISILKKEASSNQQITGIKPNTSKLNIEYCYYYLLANRHLFYKDLFKTTLPIVNQKKIRLLPIFVPAIKQQNFIVDFLNELKNTESVSSLNENKWGKEYCDIANKFFGLKENNTSISTQLTHQLSLVKQLRQSFLREAMQGKLVAQNPTDEPATELLAKIKAEKEQLIKEKKIKKQKPLPPITKDEIPFEIPDNWAWCRLGEICDALLGGYAFKSSKYVKQSNNQVIRLGNVKPNKLVLETNPALISDDYANEAEKTKLLKGDILITMTGTRAKRDYLFTLLLEEEDLIGRNLFLNQRVGSFRFNHNLSLYFINYLLKEPKILEPVYLSSTGAANQANIGVTALYNILIPLPPLPEQKRIVAKLDKLMAYCNSLEESIKNSQVQNEMLLGQVLREALKPKN